MPNVLPYRALVYSEKLRPHLGQLISPPYDTISRDQYSKLCAKHDLNSVRLCLSEHPESPQRYDEMANLFRKWKKEKALEHTEKPAFYVMEERFTINGEKRRRVGFAGLLEVSPFEKKEILPHEHTLSGPKKDRLDLLKAMGAELSQIFICYRDPELLIEQILESRKDEPFMHVVDEGGVDRRVWSVSDASMIKKIQTLLKSQKLLIADGHHRYETAVAYHAEEKTERSKYIQVYFTNIDSPGFLILPIHRLFSLPPQMSLQSFEKALEAHYDVKDFQDGLDDVALEDEKTKGGIKLLCAFQETGEVLLLSAKNESTERAEIFSIQKHIFEGILGWNLEKLAKGIIHYEHSIEGFEKSLRSLSRGVGLFLPPTDLKLVLELAERGERMPQKSTFFYPKALSGLLGYELGII